MKSIIVLWAALGIASLTAAMPADAVPGSGAMYFSGFGADTPGGRGGRIIKVTTLAREGEGSLQAALAASGPRIVVFEVGGIIDWRKDEIVVSQGQLTVAGETAPSPGITIIRGSLTVSAPDIIIRHLRVRPGDGGDLKAPNWAPDSMGASGPQVKNVLFDHCSTSWSIDENLSVSGPRVKNGTSSFVTLRSCIIGEALDKSTHPKGPHSKDRDAIDRRLVQDYLDRKGRVIDSQDEVGGYPKAAATHRALDVPRNAADVDAWLARYRAEVEY